MKIRIATIDDVDALVALHFHVHKIHAANEPDVFKDSLRVADVSAAFRKMLGEPEALWIIAEAPEPIGYLYAGFYESLSGWYKHALKGCDIRHIAVHPDARRRGVAKALLAALVAEANSLGYKRIDLTVWTFNHEAKAAFSQMGFSVYNERMTLKQREPN